LAPAIKSATFLVAPQMVSLPHRYPIGNSRKIPSLELIHRILAYISPQHWKQRWLKLAVTEADGRVNGRSRRGIPTQHPDEISPSLFFFYDSIKEPGVLLSITATLSPSGNGSPSDSSPALLF